MDRFESDENYAYEPLPLDIRLLQGNYDAISL